MALPSSGEIKFSQIRTEFGAGQNRIGQYRRDDTAFSNKSAGDMPNLPLDDGIPTGASSQISFSQMRGKKLNVVVDVHSSSPGDETSYEGKSDYSNIDKRVVARSRYDANRIMVVGGFKSNAEKPAGGGSSGGIGDGAKVIIHVNKKVGSKAVNDGNDERRACALRTGTWGNGLQALHVEVGDEGDIRGAGGKGGNGQHRGPHNTQSWAEWEVDQVGDECNTTRSEGGGEVGNSAIGVQHNGTTINVRGGGNVRAGFGGGGGGNGQQHSGGGWEGRGGGGGGGGGGWPPGEGGEGGEGEGEGGTKAGESGEDGGDSVGGEYGDGQAQSPGGFRGGAGGGWDGEERDGAEDGQGNGGTENAGGSGSAIRKSSDEMSYTLTINGSPVAEDMESHEEVSGERADQDSEGENEAIQVT